MIHGRYFEASSSASREADLDAGEAGRCRLRIDERTIDLEIATLDVSARIGRVPRRIRLADGATFETDDNDGIDALLQAGGVTHSWIAALERRWPVAVGALVAVALISVVFIRYGLPALAGFVAGVLPASADRLIGMQSLVILDKSVLHDSQLTAQRQAALRQMFASMTDSLHDGHSYRLELRSSRSLGPNALALPAGIVVMTDQLVVLAKNDQQIAAVLAHEIGHVRGRHALRFLLQSAGVSALALVVLGDVSSVTALASAAPVLLQAKHSRDFEREADGFARQWLDTHGIPQRRFDEILCAITRSANHKGDGGGAAFLATHPATGERARCGPP
jgi:Zn-dependent protease with chaperone function